MFASKFLRFVLITCLSLVCRIAFAQEPILQNNPLIRTSISVESGFIRFRGDSANSRFSNGNTNLGLFFNLHYSAWRLSFNASSSKFAWNDQANLGRSNFQCSMQNAGVMVGRFLFNTIEGKRFNPFAMLGVSALRSNTQTDLFDKNGSAYYYWNDGSIRDVAESYDYNPSANILKRDYTYETALALGQKSLSFPIELGISAAISSRISVEVSWKDLLLQSDNLDVNTENVRWDNIQQINLKLNVGLHRNATKTKQTRVPSAINYSDVDLRALMNEDEDSDGIVDANDKCLGTPKGSSIDKNGCMLDVDMDGIPDFRDKQNDTPTGSWVDENGVAQTDAWLKEHYRDSSSYFVQVLRKINKNSRPFPIRKYIPKENYQRWAIILEDHPEWRTRSELSIDKFPSELKVIDSNNDNYISLKELQQATNDLFDGKKNMNEQLLIKAMNYAFQEQ